MSAAIVIKQFLKRRVVPKPVWNGLHRLRSRYSLSRYLRQIENFAPRDVQHSYQGFPLTVHLADPEGESWYDRETAEFPGVRFLRQNKLRPGARVFDIGAHQSVVAMVLARVVGPSGRVIAVEANPHNVAVGRRNCALNGIDWIDIVPAAGADRSGTLKFNRLVNSHVDVEQGQLGLIEVPAITVDQLCQIYGTPDVLFMDVEGYECHVLHGASQTLASRPDCMVEVHVGTGLENYGRTAKEILSFFPAEAFELFLASESELDFVPVAAGQALMRERFFLGAIGRREI